MKTTVLALTLLSIFMGAMAGELQKKEFRFSDDQFKRMRKAERIKIDDLFKFDCKDYSSPMTFELVMNVEQLGVSYCNKYGSKIVDEKMHNVYFCFMPTVWDQEKKMEDQLDQATCVVLVKSGTSLANKFSRFLASIGKDNIARCYLTLDKRSLVEGTFTQILPTAITGRKYCCMLREFMSGDEYEKRRDSVKYAGAKKTKGAKTKDAVVLPSISNSVSIAMFKADRTAKPVRYIAKAKLDDYYNYEFGNCKKSHWSIGFDCKDTNGNTGDFHGYVQKNSALGEKVVGLLKDDKKHVVEVVLSHPSKHESSDCCDVL